MRAAILLATYNGEAYIREFLESLTRQDSVELSVFVRDDGSSDTTLLIVRDFISRLPIRLVNGLTRLGPANSFFELLREAGDGFDAYLFADQDDIWQPYKVARAINHIAEATGPALYLSRFERVTAKLDTLSISPVPVHIGPYNALCESIAPGCVMAMNGAARRLLLSIGLAPRVMHDRWCYFVLSALGQVIYDEKMTIQYRIHDSNTIGSPTSLAEQLSRRLRNFRDRRFGVYSISPIVSAYIGCAESECTPLLRQHLTWLKKGKSSLLFRIVSVARVPVRRQSLVDTFLVKVLILINAY